MKVVDRLLEEGKDLASSLVAPTLLLITRLVSCVCMCVFSVEN